jgi:hypothetical protein
MQDIEELGFCLIEELPEEGFEEPEYHRDLEEDVLFQIDGDDVYILGIWASDGSDRHGWVSMDSNHDGPIDYMIWQNLTNKRPGYYVAERCTLDYSSDYYGEVDADLYFDQLRPARIYEIREAEDWRLSWKQFPNQLYLHLLHLWGSPI